MAYQFVARAADLPEGSGKLFQVDGHRVALFNLGGQFHAIDDICTHEEASLAEGAIDGETVECPWHGALFNIKTGAALTMPAVTAVQTYAVKVQNGEIHIDVSSPAPTQAGT
ncbi:non-heme iron oxygenase ferredoxin subunit [bacterium]|nr:non-heme iron oxygenase ferredoxin subunit [bacterium]